MGPECKAPGGKLDPNKEKVWEAYRKRREEAAKAGKGTGDKGKGGFDAKSEAGT